MEIKHDDDDDDDAIWSFDHKVVINKLDLA